MQINRKIIVLVLCTSISLSLYSQPAQKLWPVSDPLFGLIEQLYMMQGAAAPSTSGPWTTGELQQMLEYLDACPADGSKSYWELREAVTERLGRESRFAISENIDLDTSLIYSFECYMHTNADAFYEASHWQYGWLERAPFLELPLLVSADQIFSLALDIPLMQRLFDDEDEPWGIYQRPVWTNNYLCDYEVFDVLIPYHASAAAGGSSWKLQIGREQLSWGPGHTGNLLLTDHLPFHDQLLFSFWGDSFKFTTAMLDFPSPVETGIGEDSIKMLFVHRFEFSLFRKARFSLTESMMYQDTVMNLRFLNPIFIYHQYFISSRSNSFLTIEGQVTPVRGLSLYGQLGIDDLRVIGESASRPNAIGIQGGIEYLLSRSSGNLLLWGEYTYTDPMLYQREGIDYIVSFKVRPSHSGSEDVWEYLGYPAGSDAVCWAAGLRWDTFEAFSSSFTAEYLLKGETPLHADYPPEDTEAISPTGIPERSLVLTISADRDFLLGRAGRLGSIYTNLSWSSIWDRDHISSDAVSDLQGTIGMHYWL